MATRSRFLRNASMPPPSARYNSESYRSGSISRNARSTSIAPARDSYRSSSIAPARSSSVAPVRASSVAPYRASSIAPYRASSVTPYRATSVTRASSVAPFRSTSMRSASVAPLRASSVAPLRSRSVAPQASSGFIRSSSVAPRSSSILDTTIPKRQFGNRLAYQKIEKEVSPAIYDEYYGMTYVPSGGRDSWSAYRISDETLDDNDELVYQSAKKDYEVMKRINKQIARAMSVPPPKYAPVAPATRKFTPKPVPQVVQYKKEAQKLADSKPVEVITQQTSRPPRPEVRVSYRARDTGNEKPLSAKQRYLANEQFDLTRPSAYKSLRERLAEAKNSMARTKYGGSRYYDPEMSKIDAEVKAITSNRNLRVNDLNVNQMKNDHQQVSELRKRLRSTLRRTRNSDNSL